ncbi:MAG: hypothetical protein ABW168_03615 [Sedimenticola sp.]
MKMFTFTYQGQVLDGTTSEHVKQRLAQQFKTSANDFDGLFNGDQLFERTDLPLAVAKQYLQFFHRAGAIGVIVEQNNNSAVMESVAGLDNNSQNCPNCQSHNIDTQQCLDCGVFFHKLRPAQEAKRSDNDDEVLSRTSTDVLSAARLLKYSGLLILIIFIMDNFLRGAVLSGFFEFDIGYFPYIAAHTFLVYACSRFAKAKGYSPALGALGLLSFLGVSILLMLKDRTQDDAAISIKAKGLTALCLLIALVWLNDFGSRQNDLSTFHVQASEFTQQLNQYPSSAPIVSSELLLKQRALLNTFHNSIFNAMQQHDYRPAEKVALAELAFSETANYRVWLNYQRFLMYTEQQAALPELGSKYIKKLDADIAQLFEL